jgi:4a-hydroxytetrahydrobiopterin dehydratase
MSRPTTLPEAELRLALATLPEWAGDTRAIWREVTAPSFPAAITLVGRVAEVAEQMDHHPDIDIRYRRVTFTLSTHDAGGVTSLDVEQAGRIDDLAQALDD